MKRSFWFLCVGIFLVGVVALGLSQGAHAQNDLLNSGFEEGTGTDADYWTEGVQHYRSSERAHMGSYSLKSEYLDVGTHTLTTASISVVPGTYYVSYWAWRDSAAGSAFLQIDYYYGADPTFATTTTTGAWQYVSGSWTVSTADEVYLWLVTENMTAGVYFDDICFSTTLANCAQNTATPTRTSTPSQTGTRTKTPTISQTPTSTKTPTNTNTPNNTATATYTPTPTSTKTPLSTFVWATSAVEVDSDLLDDTQAVIIADPPTGSIGYIYTVLEAQSDDGDWIISIANLVDVDPPYDVWNFMVNGNWAGSMFCTGTDPDWTCSYYDPGPLGAEGAGGGLVFPWKPGTRSVYGVSGIHTSYYISGAKAVDFVGGDAFGSDIMPAYAYGVADGTITSVCRDDHNAGVVVNSGAAGQFLYLHLNPFDSTLQVGAHIYAARPISSLVYGSFGEYPTCPSTCTDGSDCHCGCASQGANNYHLHFGFLPNAGYLQIGGCNLNVSTQMWVCGSSTIGVNGKLSSGSNPSPGPDPGPGPSPVLGGEHIWDGILVAIGTLMHDSVSQWLPDQNALVPALLDDGRIILDITMLVMNVYIFGPNSFTTSLMLMVFTFVITTEITLWALEKLLDVGGSLLGLWKNIKDLLPFL
jgi:hypothetical protein